MLTTLRSLFTLRRDERWLALVLLAPLVALQALMLHKFSCLFAHPTDASWMQFMHNFRMSGFDPTTYAVVLHWYQGYDILRHPLLALFVWPLSMLNAGLSALMGTNCVQLVVGVVLIASAFYALLWLWRTLRFVVGVGRCTAWLLTLLFMGFGMIAVTVCVPDHFCLSLPLLSLTLYVSGLKLKQGTRYSAWQAIVLFVLTAGVTLSNGIVVLLAIAITNGRAVFRPRFFFGALVLPACLMLAAGMGQRMMQQRKVSLSGTRGAANEVDTPRCEPCRCADRKLLGRESAAAPPPYLGRRAVGPPHHCALFVDGTVCGRSRHRALGPGGRMGGA